MRRTDAPRKTTPTFFLSWVLVLTFNGAMLPAERSEGGVLLWQIGKADDDTREFALGPRDYSRFEEDPVFVVGRSEASKDWCYVHPGPADDWAQGRPHSFSIVFGLKALPKHEFLCRLQVDLVDTHWGAPPRLRIAVNGHSTERQMPKGAGTDEAVNGAPAKGREERFEVRVPSSQLRVGTNTITIENVAGSWVLYDWLGFETPSALELGPCAGTVLRAISTPPVLFEGQGSLKQAVRASVLHFGTGAAAEVQVGPAAPQSVQLRPGRNVVDGLVDAVDQETSVNLTVRAEGELLARETIVLAPVRRWVVYLLPHSHVDIGYTQLQTKVERDHWRFYEQAIQASKETADYPEGAQFKWNAEVLWATDSYLRQATPEKRQAFLQAVKKGWIGLDALYGNELTALCRAEELVRLTDFAVRLGQSHGLPIDSAMISDVPGYTWGLIPVLAHSGVRWISIGPNGGHRIGHTLSEWGDKPFWWVSPSGKHRVLTWIAKTGYYRGFRGQGELLAYLASREESGYPFDLVQIRHCLGDNAGPGVELSEFVKDWNTRYAYPKLKIATTRELFLDFEKRYGNRLPVFRGDFTPYWEDGAASSAGETALNRAAAERLTQVETLWALLAPSPFPDQEFYSAWRNVLLYDEHTWGAHNSISQPDSAFAKNQWEIKQAFARNADAHSRGLLSRALASRAPGAPTTAVATLDVYNTASWPRSDLVSVPASVPLVGDVIKDASGHAVPSQRLTTGELAFLARDVPPLGVKRFAVERGAAARVRGARAEGSLLDNGVVSLTVDTTTGAIAGLKLVGGNVDFVDRTGGRGLNDYFYVAGRAPIQPQRNSAVTISVKERGPLVASLLIESEAPGCHKLTREISVVAGMARVDIRNVVDKRKVRQKEGVHLAFPFNVPGGVLRLDTPWAVVRPEVDQLPGACKNYFTVQRWVDVSNDEFGLTWATVDAPLIEIGEITTDPIAYKDGWIRKLKPSTTFFSYLMNNYWETNYKADQEGPTVFRYSLAPHGRLDLGAAQRFGVECSQKLIVAPADPARAPPVSPLRVSPEGVLVTVFKPSRDGGAWVVRLFNASGRSTRATLDWTPPGPTGVYRSGFAEEKGDALDGPIEMADSEMVTIRAELRGAAGGGASGRY